MAAAISGFVGVPIRPGTEANVLEQLNQAEVPRHRFLSIAKKLGKECPSPVNMATFAPFLLKNLR